MSVRDNFRIESPARQDAGDGTVVATTVGASLDHQIGAWTAAEADELDRALQELETLDEPSWE